MALVLGLISALSWGAHDFLVRFVSDKITAISSLLAVLIFGTMLQFPLVIGMDDLGGIANLNFMFVVLSGFAYTIGGVGLFHAFSIGPVSLVSPIIASFSVLTVLLGAFTGLEVSAMRWMLVMTALLGITIVAVSVEKPLADGRSSRKIPAILWSGLAAIAYACAIYWGQKSVLGGNEILATFMSRVMSIVTLLVIIVSWRIKIHIPKALFGWLILMGAMDLTAMMSIFLAGFWENAHFAAVGASSFGLVTILLARILLRENMNIKQWLGITLCFGAIIALSL